MTCPHCSSNETGRRGRRTSLEYQTFACRTRGRLFNERTGTGFNDLQYPTDIVLLTVLWRLRYKLGFRHWESRFAPLLADQLRTKRCGRAGRSWYLDETYVKVAGRWCYLYRAIDGDGQLIDAMLSKHRVDELTAGSCGGWSRWRSGSLSASPRTSTPPTAGRSAGSSAVRPGTGRPDTSITTPSRAIARCSSATIRCRILGPSSRLRSSGRPSRSCSSTSELAAAVNPTSRLRSSVAFSSHVGVR